MCIRDSDGAGQSLDIRIPGLKEVCCSVHFHLGPEYPSSAPPVYELSAPFLKREEKREIHAILGEITKIIGMKKKPEHIVSESFFLILHTHEIDEVYLDNLGEPVIFAWVERIREYLEKRGTRNEGGIENERPGEEESSDQLLESLSLNDDDAIKLPTKCPEIVTGDCIEDRKSVFQVRNRNAIKRTV